MLRLDLRLDPCQAEFEQFLLVHSFGSFNEHEEKKMSKCRRQVCYCIFWGPFMVGLVVVEGGRAFEGNQRLYCNLHSTLQAGYSAG